VTHQLSLISLTFHEVIIRQRGQREMTKWDNSTPKSTVLHQYVTHNRYYPSQKQFADAILAFKRETIPQEWTKFRDKV
jgi:hypoxanthine phosphoribosyltransferase